MKLNFRFLLTCLAVTGYISTARAATFDNFNDGIDDGWTYYNPIPVAFSFPMESGSVAYKMMCPWGSLFSPGRIGSINMTEPAHTKFHVEADLLNWTYNWGRTLDYWREYRSLSHRFFFPRVTPCF
jgi:hypothetical protein